MAYKGMSVLHVPYYVRMPVTYQHWQRIRLIQEHNKTEKQVPLREPDLMIVMTGGSMAYTRPDGVKVIPLACLKD